MRFGWSVLAAMLVGFGILFTSSAAASAPVGTITADPPTQTNGHAPAVHGAALPNDAFINRPTVSMSDYRAAKAGTGSDRRPGTPTPPAGTRDTASTIGFNGVTQATSGGYFPPDINGAVSANKVAEIVNSHLAAYTRSGVQTSDRSLAALTGYSAQGIFDPRLLYDPTYKRWVFIAEAFPESAGVQAMFIGISKNASPDGPFSVYTFNINGACGSGNFWDYPQLGMNQDAVVITGNCFDASLPRCAHLRRRQGAALQLARVQRSDLHRRDR